MTLGFNYIKGQGGESHLIFCSDIVVTALENHNVFDIIIHEKGNFSHLKNLTTYIVVHSSNQITKWKIVTDDRILQELQTWMAKMLKKKDRMTTFRLNIPPSWDKQFV